MLQQRGEQGEGLEMSSTLENLGQQLIYSLPSSQLDVSSGDKGRQCFAPLHSLKTSPGCFVSPFPMLRVFCCVRKSCRAVGLDVTVD